ncbi:MAG: hypothetical protein V1848_02060 [Candidatus Magasanikbacteria bacterium]
MDENKKRIIFIIGFFLLTILFGYALYRVFFAAKEEVLVPPPITGIPTGVFPTSPEGELIPGAEIPGVTPTLPEAEGVITGVEGLPTEKPKVTQIISTAVNNFSVGQLGKANYYQPEDGKFYKIASDGSTQALDEKVFYNVENVNWSPVSDEAIIEYPDGSNIYYNFTTKKQVTLPQHWEEFSFTDSGAKIAAKSMGLSEENRWLVVADPTGKNAELIEPLGNNADKVIIDWSPNNQIVGMSLTGEALGADRQELLFVGLNGENYQSTVVEGRGLVTEWSPDGDRLLYSVYSARSDFKPELWIVNANPSNIGTGRQALRVNTWANKCTFADDRYVYCGVPISLDSGAGFAPEIADSTSDQIFRIDTVTGARTLIQTDQFHVIDTIQVDETTNKLYFTDKLSSGVFSVQL